jgi:hypothetical protein
MHAIPRIGDYLPTLGSFPNRFVRTKASMATADSAAAWSHSHAHGTAAASTLAMQPSSQSAQSASPSSPSSGNTAPAALEDISYSQYIRDGDVVLLDIVRRSGLGEGGATSFIRAGPREQICWAPGEAVAAIVTCGGLCPGLNDVIAELFNTLYYNYVRARRSDSEEGDCKTERRGKMPL